MIHPLRSLLFTLVLLALVGAALADSWPTWRGPAGDGISLQRGVPVAWSAESNITWSATMDAAADSSPIVHDDYVFLNASYDGGKRRALITLDRATGEEIWRLPLKIDADGPCHNSPVTDGRVVYAAFGAGGVVACTVDGRELWHTDIKADDPQSGRASGPILYHDTLIVQAQRGDHPLLVALDKHLGTIIWQRELTDIRPADNAAFGSAATPVVIDREDQPQLIAALPGFLIAFNPRSGHEYWRCGGLGQTIIASPLVGLHTLIAADARGAMIGQRFPGAEAVGLIDDSHRLWRVDQAAAQTGSGVIIAGRAYLLDDSGALRCVNAETGEVNWTQALSPAGGGSVTYIGARLYVTDPAGATHILRASAKFDLLHTNTLAPGDTTRAAPAFSDGQIFLRTDKKLYCIGVRRN